jgi:hypothetical protein
MAKKKISIITLQSVRNYGSVLQAFATQEKFREYGFDVDILNYQRADTKNIYCRLMKWIRKDSLPQKIFKSILLFPTLLIQNIVFEEFIRQYLNIQKQLCITEEDFKKLSFDADIYCTGSDQVWNSSWNEGILRPLFLSFIPDSIPKIAYSASFGKQRLNENEKEETRKLLERYDHISVREESAVGIINELGINKAVHVLDPTLQMPKSFWEKFAGKRQIKTPYILVYQLNTNRAFDKYAKEFAKRKGMKLIRFCTRFDQMVKSGSSVIIPKVWDFVSLIQYAECIITDSFHATAFSINMNRDFISIFPNEFGNRIGSILQLTQLECRQLKSYTDFSFVETSYIDYITVNKILQQEREKGDIFLKKALACN